MIGTNYELLTEEELKEIGVELWSTEYLKELVNEINLIVEKRAQDHKDEIFNRVIAEMKNYIKEVGNEICMEICNNNGDSCLVTWSILIKVLKEYRSRNLLITKE